MFTLNARLWLQTVWGPIVRVTFIVAKFAQVTRAVLVNPTKLGELKLDKVPDPPVEEMGPVFVHAVSVRLPDVLPLTPAHFAGLAPNAELAVGTRYTMARAKGTARSGTRTRRTA
jgi:hypothetical protein